MTLLYLRQCFDIKHFNIRAIVPLFKGIVLVLRHAIIAITSLLKARCPSPSKAFPSNRQGKGGKIHVRTNDGNESLYSNITNNLPLAHMWPFQLKALCHISYVNRLCHSL